ncbi:MAG: hypothetical protein ACLQMO_10615 [Acidobacteriaceae bacterium]
MILTSSDVGSLSRSLSRWEIAEYVSELFVIVGCGGELVADFFTRLSESVRKRIGKWSTIVLILALSFELTSLIKTNELSGGVIGSLGNKAKQADATARKALTDSGNALSQSGDAEAKSGKANTLSSNALVLARGARSEADSSKKEATKAENDLAAALQRTASLEQQLSWRTVTPEQKTAIRKGLLRTNILPLRGWEIRFSIPMGCAECEGYADALMNALGGLGGAVSGPDAAGYIRVPEGVMLSVNPINAMGQVPLLLLNDLRANGVDAQGATDGGLPEHTIKVAIGVKPHATP